MTRERLPLWAALFLLVLAVLDAAAPFLGALAGDGLRLWLTFRLGAPSAWLVGLAATLPILWWGERRGWWITSDR